MNLSPGPWWIAPAVIAALVAATVGIITLIVHGRRARTDRQREVFASAFGEVSAYREFPYIVWRRRGDEPDAERQRISTELIAVQSRLNQNQALLRVEAPRVARPYAELVAATRRVAGAAISAGWDREPITNDSGIHIADVDLSGLVAFEDRYLAAAADHLSLAPWWVCSTGRWLRSRLAAWRHGQVRAHTPPPVPPASIPAEEGTAGAA